MLVGSVVREGVNVRVGCLLPVAVAVALGVRVFVGVAVGRGVRDGALVRVADGPRVGVLDGVRVAVGSGPMAVRRAAMVATAVPLPPGRAAAARRSATSASVWPAAS